MINKDKPAVSQSSNLDVQDNSCSKCPEMKLVVEGLAILGILVEPHEEREWDIVCDLEEVIRSS